VSTTNEWVLARAVLTMAAAGGMPDTFWHTDSRIALACQTLGWDPDHARDWAYDAVAEYDQER
jgi:hypothetical protein